MCLATPLKIIKIENEKATVESGIHQYTVNISLIKDAKVGDYILAHGELAINKIPEEEAKKIIAIIGAQKENAPWAGV